jgi:hypothetical protein
VVLRGVRLQLEGGRGEVGVFIGEGGAGREAVIGKACDLAGADWVGLDDAAGGGVKNA